MNRWMNVQESSYDWVDWVVAGELHLGWLSKK